MNYGRFAGAVVAGAVVDLMYGFVVYGMLLRDQFALHSAVYRPAEDMSYFPYLVLGIFVAMIPATYMYAKGYEGGSGVSEGARFGAAIGLLMIGYVAFVNYAVLNIGRRLAASLAVAGFIEWCLLGVVIGLVYKPASVATARRAGV